LFHHQVRLEFTCRFQWQPGSLAFWDNRCAQHNAVNDYAGFRRIMHRVTLAGDAPREALSGARRHPWARGNRVEIFVFPGWAFTTGPRFPFEKSMSRYFSAAMFVILRQGLHALSRNRPPEGMPPRKSWSRVLAGWSFPSVDPIRIAHHQRIDICPLWS